MQESREGIDRIRDIVISLRNFARLDEAPLKKADINEGLRSTLQLIRPLCKNRIAIAESYADLPLLLCRPGELNQVFLNLLTNAVQAIPGKGEIRVATRCDPGQLLVEISDTGQGMEAATLARLGEPFFTTKPVGDGTGLGLAVSFGIVERHRGRLKFASAVGVGTTATIELPIGGQES